VSDEHYGFVFAVTFIIVFSALMATMPQGLQGQGATPDIMTPVNPNLLTDFADTEEFNKTNFGGVLSFYYVYDLPTGGTTWECVFATDSFFLGAHALFLGLWLGGYNWVNFISDNGTDYGTSVSFDDIESDAEDGVVRYTLQYEDTGNAAGGFIFYWNITTYSDPSDAWDNDELILLHGIGLTTDTNIASLLLSLLFLQIPEVPFLVNVLLVTPIWASIIFVAWFIIKSMIPLLG